MKIKKIENLQEYFRLFDIDKFINSVKIIPEAWSQTKTGDDDTWGVSLIRSNNEFDPYFVISYFLNHPKLGELWRESAYTPGSEEKKRIEKRGMIKEWEIAKRVQKEMHLNILQNYSPDDHYSALEKISQLLDKEILLVERIYSYDKIDSIAISPYVSGHCSAFGLHTRDQEKIFLGPLNNDDVLRIVMKGLFEEIVFTIFFKTLRLESTKEYEYLRSDDFSYVKMNGKLLGLKLRETDLLDKIEIERNIGNKTQ